MAIGNTRSLPVRWFCLIGALLVLVSALDPADAQRRGRTRRSRARVTRTIPVTNPSQIKASAAILIDADTGQVLFEKNADAQRPPASTTKIMTALLLLEHLRPDEWIYASKTAAETGGSSLHLKEGERISARDMLYALMLRSANDGCVAVAERIAGSEARFADMMTQRARELGANNTLFLNSHGLNCDGHVSTARDLAMLARYASNYPEFLEATRSKYWNVSRTTGSKDTLLKNHAKFLWKFPGADGIKTGWTVPAGRCFVGGATWNGWRLISVVLNSPNMVNETAVLMKHGFNQFQRTRVAAAGTGYGVVQVSGGSSATVPAVLKEPLYVIQPRSDRAPIEVRTRLSAVEAPVTAGAEIGVVEAYANGKLLSSGALVAGGPVGRSTALSVTGGGRSWYYGVALVGLVGLGYGSSVAKAARIRRRRLKAILRSADHGR